MKYQYKGYHRRKKMNEIKKDMETEMRPVRCIDCISRKKCPILRNNKYTLKPCNKFVIDLAKQARILERKYKK